MKFSCSYFEKTNLINIHVSYSQSRHAFIVLGCSVFYLTAVHCYLSMHDLSGYKVIGWRCLIELRRWINPESVYYVPLTSFLLEIH
jgi:hypothetical protein